MDVSGPAAAVAALPGGGIAAASGDLVWLTDRSGASESLNPDYGPLRRRLKDIRALAAAPDGRLAVADAGNNRVWELVLAGAPEPRGPRDLDGARTTWAGAPIRILAGAGTTFYPIGDGAKAVAAQLDSPSGVTWLPDGSLLVSDTGHGRVQRVGPDGRISSLAGTGVPGPGGDGGPALKAFLAGPGSLAAGPDGSAIVAEAESRIRRIAPDGTIATLARAKAAGLAIGPDGTVFASVGTDVMAFWDGGEALILGGLHGPLGLAVLPGGALAVADTDRVVFLEPAEVRREP